MRLEGGPALNVAFSSRNTRKVAPAKHVCDTFPVPKHEIKLQTTNNNAY